MTDECIHLMVPSTCTICNGKRKRSASQPPKQKPKSDVLIPIDVGNAVVAGILSAAQGSWMTSEEVGEAVLANDELGPLIRAACADGDTQWRNPRLRAGNVVGWWSSSWTRGGNAYIGQFDREGPDGGPYRYSLKTEEP